MNLPIVDGVVNAPAKKTAAWDELEAFVPLRVWHLPRLARTFGPGIAVYAYLLRCGEDAFPSQERIAKYTGLTAKQVNKALEKLRSKGAVRITRRGRRVHYAPDLFDLSRDALCAPPPESAPPPAGGIEYPLQMCDKTPCGGYSKPPAGGAEVRTGKSDGRSEEKVRSTPYPQTGADAPERPDMNPSQWRDLQAEAEALWGATDAGDGTDAVASTQPSATATPTPSDHGGTPIVEAQTAPETAPPPSPPFALEPPGPPAKAKRGRAAKPTCPPEALETLRKAWCIYVGGRAQIIPAGFAEACADLLEQTKGDQQLVIRAFKGFAKSDWHMGRDERSNGHKYAHPRYVARDLDSFLAMADAEDSAAGSAAEQEFHAAEADLDRLLSQHGAALELELEDLPIATSERAKTRFGPHGGMDREGVLRGVRVAYRLERDGEISGSGTRFSRYTQRCAIEAVLAKMAADQWGHGSLHHRAQVERLRSLVRATESVAALHHDEMERRRAEEILFDRRPDWWTPEDDACLDASRMAVDTALTQDASKEPVNA